LATTLKANAGGNVTFRATMQIQYYELEWDFDCQPWGDRDEQAEFLRDHMCD
jgi:hypothetical protein